MDTKNTAIALTLLLGLGGCSAHSPMIMTSTTDVKPTTASAKYSPHSNKVFVTSGNLPTTVKYEDLGQLDVGKVWYGDSDNALEALADGARKLGADAVIEVKTWHQPSGWSWAAPHGAGKAVKITQPEKFDFNGLTGDWK
jgi:hypothetical protein